MREIKFRTLIENGFVIMKWNNGQWETSIFPLKKGIVLNPIIKELQQFTGLRDRDGVNIYEGDILYYKTTRKEYYVQVIFNKERGNYEEYPHLPFATTLNDGEIVGNIYENKELLK